MKGKRVAATHRSVRRSSGKRYTRHDHAAENQQGSRLLFLCVILLLIAALKFMFPQQVAEFTQSAGEIIGKKADFSAAFAAVGRAVSGEENVGESLQDAFLAVFNPSEMQFETGGEENVPSLSVSDAQLSQEQDITDEMVLSGTYSMLSLPEDASLELRNLGFSCTTPVVGALSSAFGWREHPSEGGTKFHYGIDLAAELGSEIVAFADGEVFAVGESSTLGKYIILVHPGGYKTLYAHCSEVIVKNGSVKMGNVIARVGESGSATGPHLHFELQDGALYLNPIYYVSIS